MAKPNTLFNNVRDRARKAVNSALEQREITDADLDTAAEAFDLSNYNAFFADCRKADHPTKRCGALWTSLKARGDAPEGGQPETETASGTTDDSDTGREPAPPAPETIEQLEAEFNAADQAYLITTTGCPSCNQAKKELKDWIGAGLIEVLNIQTDDLAADIVIETNLDAVPALVLEQDGRFGIV